MKQAVLAVLLSARLVLAQAEVQPPPRGWAQLPMLVYAKDLGPGVTLDKDSIRSRTTSEALLTRNVAPPDTFDRAIGLKLMVPVKAGDPVRWSDLSAWKDVEAFEACHASTPGLDAEKTLGELRKRLLRSNAPKPAGEMVVMTSGDLAAGSPITVESLRKVKIPKEMITESMVTPEEVRALAGARLRVAVVGGETLTWQLFANSAAWERHRKCVAAVLPRVQAAADGARTSAVTGFAKPGASGESPPPFKPDANGKVAIVVAATQIASGVPLTAAMLATLSLPAAALTSSYVPAEHSSRFVGKALLTSLQPGDPVFWQAVSGDDCTTVVAEAVKKARRAAALEAAKGFKP